MAKKKVLTGKNAAFAAAAAAIADIVASLFFSDYAGLFSSIAAVLVGG